MSEEDLELFHDSLERCCARPGFFDYLLSRFWLFPYRCTVCGR